MIDQIISICRKRKNTIILVLTALLVAQCMIKPRLFPKTSLHVKFSERAKRDAFGEIPPGLKVATWYGYIREYEGKSDVNFAFIVTELRQVRQRILKKLGMYYLIKVRELNDTKNYYSKWERLHSLDEIQTSSPTAFRALDKLKSYCQKDNERLKNSSSNSLPAMQCRLPYEEGFYYSYSSRGAAIVSNNGNYVYIIFSISSADL